MLRLFCYLVPIALPCLAQNPYIRESIGQPAQDPKTLASYHTAPRVEMSDWVDKTFIFLPRDRAGKTKPYRECVRKSLYELFENTLDLVGKRYAQAERRLALARETLDLAKQGNTDAIRLGARLQQEMKQDDERIQQNLQMMNEQVARLKEGTPYNVLVGRQARVAFVKDYFSGYHALELKGKAVFLVLGEEDVYVMLAAEGTMAGLALLSDIDLARRRWRGLQVHPKTKELMTYDVETDTYGKLQVSRSETLTVTDVVAGFEQCAPARVILLTPMGQEAFQDFSVSNTNCPSATGWPTFTNRFEVVQTPAGQ